MERSATRLVAMAERRPQLDAWVGIGQGLWYIGPGLWLGVFPDHYRRVHRVKRDYWIERAHALCLTAIGATLAASGLRRRPTPETRLLGLSMALGLAATDLTAARKTRLAGVYFVDLAGELVFAALGALRWWRRD